jgi:hypothetical protein
VKTSAGIFKQSIGARNLVGIGLSYRPARLYMLTELIPWNRFLGFLKVQKIGLSPVNVWQRRKGGQREREKERELCFIRKWNTNLI